MHRTVTSLLALALAAMAALPAAAGSFPDVIALPDGWRPEGITAGIGTDAYVGSLGTGAVYGVDLATGEGEIVVPAQEDRIAVGLAHDARSGLIFAAGGPAGAAYVYDSASGDSVAMYQFVTGEDTFVNDVVVTRRAAYFTDSFRPYIYRVPLGPAGALPEGGSFEPIELGGDFVLVEGFNANGIVATADGASLIIVHSTRGELYAIDPESGDAALIDLGGATVPNGDGLALVGHTLYVMQNRINQISVVALNRALSTGDVTKIITDAAFDVPTTIAEFGSSLYAVNARFGTPPTPETNYDIVRVKR